MYSKSYFLFLILSKTVDEEDIPCAMCLEDLIFDDDDQIVICDLCNSGFHQSCYGSELLGANLEELPGKIIALKVF